MTRSGTNHLHGSAFAYGTNERLGRNVPFIRNARYEKQQFGVSLSGPIVRDRLLFFLASNPRNVFSRYQLMNRVWGYEAARDTGTVTVHIRRLRAKIEQDPANPLRLQTIWGVGYRFLP